jgi:Zn-dependent peptidase ImmA (M78 family)
LGYRRGFKTEANGLVTEIRSELGLDALERFDAWVLADHLAIEVMGLSSLRTNAPGVSHLLDTEPEAFSAVTVFRGTERTVVHNDAHSSARQSSDVTHELAHGLLHHQPTPALDNFGCRLWDQNIEDEAGFLAGALLLTEDAALHIARSGVTAADAAAQFGISTQMVIYRLNVTGARVRVERARARRAS